MSTPLLRPTTEQFATLLPSVCSKETSADPDGWRPENPLWGHCAVVSLIAQNLFGGTLLRASLEKTQFAFMRSHYLNKFTNGLIVDFTEEQFGVEYPEGLGMKGKSRSDVLSYKGTRARYKELAFRFAQAVSGNNPIFDDPFYGACFHEALDSGCQKLWVGCVLVRDGAIVSYGHNKPVKELAHVCQSKCIRFNIQSRTESMIGACAHAEEYALWNAARAGVPLCECDMYVAIVGIDGLPRFRHEPVNTCLRCAVQTHLAGIRNLYVDVKDRWVAIKTGEGLTNALAYAQEEKKI